VVCLTANLASLLVGPMWLTTLAPVGFLPCSLLLAGVGLLGGALVHWRHNLRESAELRAQRQSIVRSRQRLQDLERIIPELIIETNDAGELLYANESARTKLALPDPAVGRVDVMSLIVSRDREIFSRFQDKALGGGIPTVRCLHLFVHGGECLPVRAVAAPILSVRDGRVVGMRIVFTDIRSELAYSQALSQRHTVEVTVTEILKALTTAGDDQWDQALADALASLQRLVALDQCALLRFNGNGGLASEYQWSGPDVDQIDPGGQFAQLGGMSWVIEPIRAGEIVHVEDADTVQEVFRGSSDDWRLLGVCSLLVVPLFSEGQVTGLMAFNTVSVPADWVAEDIRLLETLTGMIAGSWHRRLARREQRAASQRFMDIIEFLPDATFVVDAQGCIMAWNKAMAELTGKPREEMIGQGDRAYAVPFHGERAPLLIDHFADVDLADYAHHYKFLEMVGDKLYGEMFVPFMNDGRGAYLWCTATPMYDSDGQVVGAIESLRDVTYRKASELALREGEERYRRLVETMNDGLVVIDAAGQIVFVNDRLCEMSGFGRNELVGHQVGEFLPSPAAEFDPRTWSGWELEPGDALAVELPCRDGTLMPTRLSPSPLQAADGEFQGGFAVMTDMTTIRAAEARYRLLNDNLEKKVIESTRDLMSVNDALRRSEGRYRRIIESLRDGYIFYSRDIAGEFTYVSPSFRDVLGYTSLDKVAAQFSQWYEQPRNAGARLTAEKNSLGFKQPSYELQVEDAQGAAKLLEILEVPEFDQEGQLVSVEGIMHDVTEERRILRIVREAQAKLVESEKLAALGSLMAGLSHEINTPIGIGVTASSHLVALNNQCETDYRGGSLTQSGFEAFLDHSRESANLIQTNLSRAAELMQNFKQVATDQSAGLERTFNLARYFDDVMQSLSPRFNNTGFKIRCECPSDLQLRCDPGSLYQILSNLVLNSLHHGFDGMLVGEITLTAGLVDDQVVLEYRDNGNGMNREQVARIYEPFYTTRRGRGGTGLGMHIVYSNVTQTLGGNITCVSKPGRGTRFTITVPLPAEVQHG